MEFVEQLHTWRMGATTPFKVKVPARVTHPRLPPTPGHRRSVAARLREAQQLPTSLTVQYPLCTWQCVPTNSYLPRVGTSRNRLQLRGRQTVSSDCRIVSPDSRSGSFFRGRTYLPEIRYHPLLCCHRIVLELGDNTSPRQGVRRLSGHSATECTSSVPLELRARHRGCSYGPAVPTDPTGVGVQCTGVAVRSGTPCRSGQAQKQRHAMQRLHRVVADTWGHTWVSHGEHPTVRALNNTQ
jgi:hypothetical protein